MDTANISISVTEGRGRLIIDGPLDLFQKFFAVLLRCDEQSIPNPEIIILNNKPNIEQSGKN
jgi:hypothetical protein